MPSDRNDLLSKLQKGKDAEGNPMGRAELTAEALTQLIAGSDTTSKWVSRFLSLSLITRGLTNILLALRIAHLAPSLTISQ